MRDQGVQLGEPLLILLEVVELAVVGLSMPMLGAENVRALAGHLEESNLLRALPALVQVGLILKQVKRK